MGRWLDPTAGNPTQPNAGAQTVAFAMTRATPARARLVPVADPLPEDQAPGKPRRPALGSEAVLVVWGYGDFGRNTLAYRAFRTLGAGKDRLSLCHTKHSLLQVFPKSETTGDVLDLHPVLTYTCIIRGGLCPMQSTQTRVRGLLGEDFVGTLLG